MAEEPSAASSSQSSTDEEVAALYQHARSAVPAIVVVDRINKQDNIGGIVRSASALGVTHLCFVGASRDDGRRAHIGHQSSKPARVPYAHMTAAQLNLCFHDKATSFSRFPDFLACRTTLRSLGYSLVAVEISANSTPSHHFHFPLHSALLPGNETLGVPSSVLAQCDAVVHVEQWGGQQSSLNVAVATAVVLSDYMRQHGGEPGKRHGSKFVAQREAAHRQQPANGGCEAKGQGE